MKKISRGEWIGIAVACAVAVGAGLIAFYAKSPF